MEKEINQACYAEAITVLSKRSDKFFPFCKTVLILFNSIGFHQKLQMFQDLIKSAIETGRNKVILIFMKKGQ